VFYFKSSYGVTILTIAIPDIWQTHTLLDV